MEKFENLEIGDFIKFNDTWWVISDYAWSFEVVGYYCFSTTSRRRINKEDFAKVQAVKSMHEMEELPLFIEKINALIDADLAAEDIKEELKNLLYGKSTK